MINTILLYVLGAILLGFLPFMESQCLSRCKLPLCRCPNITAPGGLPVYDIPQMVLITFSGSVDGDFLQIFNKTFPTNPPKNRRNVNRCPMAATIFVRDKRTDYCAVNRLYAYGHEIGQNGLSLRNEDYWGSESREEFVKDFITLRERLVEEAKIPEDEVYGVRSPVYKVSDDYLYVADQLEYKYDSSIIIRDNTNRNPSLASPLTFPFTMDHIIEQTSPIACSNQECPKMKHSLWEAPVTNLVNHANQPCRDLTTCGNVTAMGDVGLYDLLIHNFDHYYAQKVPFMVNIDINRLRMGSSDIYMDGLNLFLDDISSLDDVWVVSINQAIEWVQTPKRTGEVESLSAWGCQSHVLDPCTVVGLEEEDLSQSANDTEEDDADKKTIRGLFPSGEVLVTWQTIILTALFIFIWQYDKIVHG